jgi:hypothetical protein
MAVAHPATYRRPASVSFSLLPDSYAQRVVHGREGPSAAAAP